MHQVHNDDRDIGAGSSGVRGRIGTDLIDLQGSGRLLGRGIDAAAGEHVRANFSLHRRAGYEKSQKRPTWQRWYSVAESAISVHPFSSRWRDATLAHLPRAKGHRRSWNRAFEKLCVCVSRPSRLPSWKLIASRGTRNRIFEMLIFLVELSMGRLLLFLEARGKEVFLFFFRIEKLESVFALIFWILERSLFGWYAKESLDGIGKIVENIILKNNTLWFFNYTSQTCTPFPLGTQYFWGLSRSVQRPTALSTYLKVGKGQNLRLD